MARHDPRRAKVHRNYTIAEAADLFGVHRNTLRGWTRRGLATIKVRSGVLILGSELRAFATSERAKRRVKCPPGAMYCVRCRDARHPPAGLVEALPITSATVNLRGVCPVCGSLMHRRANTFRLAEIGFEGLALHAPTDAPSG